MKGNMYLLLGSICCSSDPYIVLHISLVHIQAKDRLYRSCDDQQKKTAKYFQFHLSIKVEIS